ncbi:MAG: hypothetical protein P0S95_03920 [Rhabdochlamydiaceae bacterium]|nr:hypothetical protein [Candidatus Amphrikana amoebophyrae]
MLLKPYRGEGFGKKLFDMRESCAKELGKYKKLFFFTSQRVRDDPNPPQGYYSQVSFWKKRGCIPDDGLDLFISYKGVGELKESKKQVWVWSKEIECKAALHSNA